jgi:hypothetical protein
MCQWRWPEAVTVIEEVIERADKATRCTVIMMLARLGKLQLLGRSSYRFVELIEPDHFVASTNPEDEAVLAYLGRQDLKEWLERFQVFWCIGWVDRQAMQSDGKALGFSRLKLALDGIKQQARLPHLSTSIGYIRDGCLMPLEGLFDRPPLTDGVWKDEDRAVDFRAEFWHGDRRESCWTPRARKVWRWIDLFLARHKLRPSVNNPGA